MAETISLRIMGLLAEGQTIREAYDAVLGAGQFATLAADLYESLRASGYAMRL